MNLENGTIINQYKILSPIGKGGMGEVFLAEDTRLNRKAALKILPAEFAADKDRMNRFVREAQSASALNHPNIITIYEIGESEGTNFIATEFIDGQTLNDYSKANLLDYKSALDIATQVASALHTAHSANIIHRDIKPDNVMIRADGLVKILDFGIAKLSTPKTINEEDATAIKGGTSPGMIIGTANYMSPEQAKGEVVDARTDIFSFGVVLYEMLSGHLPFQGKTPMEMIGAVIHKEPKPMEENVPGEIEKIINQALRKDRNERYQTIKDLLIDLREVKQELEFQDKLEKTVSPDNAEEKTQMLKAAATFGESDQTATDQNRNDSFTIKKSNVSKAFVGALAILLVSAIGFGYWFYSISNVKQIESIAVMPFANESGNADTEYLSDGMTETLISSLSQLPNLNVKPRSSVFRYKGKETNPQTIGKELNVQAILNGRVAQRGQDIALYVELIDIASDKVVWSQQYNRKQTDLVTLQAEIARDVSGKIKTKLSGEDIAKVTKTYTTNPEAYQLYLKGNFYLTKYTEDSYKTALEYYREAIAIDPNYALAHSGIAYAYNFANGWYLPPREVIPKAKAAALKALELDETLAEAHYLLGVMEFWYEWDWLAAEIHSKRANELDPTYPAYYPIYLAAMGRFEEAVKAQEVVQQRLPLDLNINLDTAGILLAAGRYDQAIEQTRKALELDPNFWWSYQILGLAYERKKQYPEAIAALEKARQVDVNNPSNLGYLGYVYAAAGKKEEAQKVLGELKELSNRRYVSPYNIAIIYAGLNDKDQAFEWLERAYQDRSFYMTLLKTETVLDNLRDDPRYRDLLKRMNLPE